MNVLRKAMAEEAEKLKPLLDLTYHALLRYQEHRTPANERKLRAAMEPTIAQLMVFRPYMPTYKQDFFNLLESDWRELAAGDLIMLFDHCVNIMHLRIERAMTRNELEQPWSRDLLAKFDERRALPPVGPSSGEFLASGLAASAGQVVGMARVVRTEAELADLKPGEILVCPMSTPDWVPYLHLVRALVTDQGGALSHAAIVARELGLPCVTGCQNATANIRTGDRIEVNGDLGIITAV
ncbi:MAG TPA: PEP-utilizing enzyme [Symbiobacteriaceae bacterium]|nr:PEP-utilizing enzyme [Symbiobacteriaceae bacterium]